MIVIGWDNGWLISLWPKKLFYSGSASRDYSQSKKQVASTPIIDFQPNPLTNISIDLSQS
jgi:hypothetical protein